MTDVECPLCAATRPAITGPIVWVRCRTCHAMIFRDPGGPKIVIAHASDPIAQQIGVALVDAGYAPVRVTRGRDAVRVLETCRAPALVLDVAITDGLSFQVIDRVRTGDPLGLVKIVLVASVFNRTAYKRRPDTLHGADGYIEQHHVTDILPARLATLLGRPVPETRPLAADVRQRLLDGEARTDLAGAERVKALARSIVADIALYHEAEVRQAVADGDGALVGPLTEGRRLLREMVNDDELTGDPIGAAMAEILRTLEGAQ